MSIFGQYEHANNHFNKKQFSQFGVAKLTWVKVLLFILYNNGDIPMYILLCGKYKLSSFNYNQSKPVDRPENLFYDIILDIAPFCTIMQNICWWFVFITKANCQKY